MAERDEPERPRPEDDDEPAWVTALVAAGGALGMNRVRLRWKLRGWVRRRREDSNRLARKVGQVRYQHRVCGHCTAVTSRDDGTCHRCGRPLDVRAAELARRVGLPVPRGTPTTLLCVAMVAVFVASVLHQQVGDAFHIDAWSLVVHGADVPGGPDPLRAATSLLVHAGVFHLLVGMFTVAVAASLVERELSPALVIPLFLMTGAIGVAASEALGRDDLGHGAAAGVAGLIAVGAVLGQRAGTRRGITHRNELLSMGLLVLFLGLFVSTGYRAMLPAAAVGAAVAWALPREALALGGRPGLARAIGVVGALALTGLAVVAAGGWVPAVY